MLATLSLHHLGEENMELKLFSHFFTRFFQGAIQTWIGFTRISFEVYEA